MPDNGGDRSVEVIMYRCPECGAEWLPIIEHPPHYAGCSMIRIAVAFKPEADTTDDPV